jgi:hypothetical protein
MFEVPSVPKSGPPGSAPETRLRDVWFLTVKIGEIDPETIHLWGFNAVAASTAFVRQYRPHALNWRRKLGRR